MKIRTFKTKRVIVKNKLEDDFGNKYCAYCHSPIEYNVDKDKLEPYIVDNDEYYHRSCYKIMNTYVDPFGFDED